jgi:CubicO group peptidase (beta-lactamase class C family)
MRTRPLLIGLPALLSLAVLFSPAGEPSDASALIDAARLRAVLEPIRREHKLPALGAAIVRSRGRAVVAVVGVRKHGAALAAQDDDRFHIGSDTKPWTALLIAWLIEQGLLRWDTPLLDIFPELAPMAANGWRQVTITHLLTHRAGLPPNMPGGWWAVDGEDVRAQRSVVVRSVVQVSPKQEPGKKYVYSNLGYVVLGAVAERLGKESWEDLIGKVIAVPLGMKTVGFGAAGTPGKIDQPLPHEADGTPLEPTETADNPPVMGPAGRVHCSLAEWSKFVAEHLRGIRGQGALLKRTTYRDLEYSPYRDKFYTLGGWAGELDPERRPHRVLAHDGSNKMNYAVATLLPEEDIAVLVVTNQGGATAEEACHEASGRLLKLAQAHLETGR